MGKTITQEPEQEWKPESYPATGDKPLAPKTSGDWLKGLPLPDPQTDKREFHSGQESAADILKLAVEGKIAPLCDSVGVPLSSRTTDYIEKAGEKAIHEAIGHSALAPFMQGAVRGLPLSDLAKFGENAAHDETIRPAIEGVCISANLAARKAKGIQ